MQIRIKAYSTIHGIMLFDPQVLSNALNFQGTFATLENEIQPGQAIYYEAKQSGDVRLLLIIDEEDSKEENEASKAAEWNERKRYEQHPMLLEVVSGKVCVAGFEELAKWSQHENPAEYQPRFGEVIELSTGNYQVQAFELDWEERIDEVLHERANPKDEAFVGKVSKTVGSIVALSVLLGPVILGMVWFQAGMWVAAQLLGVIALFHLLVLIVTVGIISYSPAWKRMRILRSEVLDEHPNAVLILKTIEASSTDQEYKPGKFGHLWVTEPQKVESEND